jgi:hypothetical protein
VRAPVLPILTLSLHTHTKPAGDPQALLMLDERAAGDPLEGADATGGDAESLATLMRQTCGGVTSMSARRRKSLSALRILRSSESGRAARIR